MKANGFRRVTGPANSEAVVARMPSRRCGRSADARVMPDSPRHGKAADDLQRSPMDSGDSLATRAPQSEREKKPVIVVPVDFSPHSIKAAQYGMKIARDAHGLLLLVHAVHLNLSPIGPANPAWLKIALGQEAWTKAEPI